MDQEEAWDWILNQATVPTPAPGVQPSGIPGGGATTNGNVGAASTAQGAASTISNLFAAPAAANTGALTLSQANQVAEAAGAQQLDGAAMSY